MSNKRKMSLIINLLIVVLEVIGFVLSYQVNDGLFFEAKYYTDLSNLLALGVMAIFVGFLISKKKIPRWMEILKYATTICLTLTFLVVIFVLCPMEEYTYSHMLFYKYLCCQHLLCPLLGIITFIFFDEIKVTSHRENFIAIWFTILYGIVILICNILRIVDGPYPFLRVYEQTTLVSFLWLVALSAGVYVIGWILRTFQNKLNRS